MFPLPAKTLSVTVGSSLVASRGNFEALPDDVMEPVLRFVIRKPPQVSSFYRTSRYFYCLGERKRAAALRTLALEWFHKHRGLMQPCEQDWCFNQCLSGLDGDLQHLPVVARLPHLKNLIRWCPSRDAFFGRHANLLDIGKSLEVPEQVKLCRELLARAEDFKARLPSSAFEPLMSRLPDPENKLLHLLLEIHQPVPNDPERAAKRSQDLITRIAALPPETMDDFIAALLDLGDPTSRESDSIGWVRVLSEKSIQAEGQALGSFGVYALNRARVWAVRKKLDQSIRNKLDDLILQRFKRDWEYWSSTLVEEQPVQFDNVLRTAHWLHSEHMLEFTPYFKTLCESWRTFPADKASERAHHMVLATKENTTARKVLLRCNATAILARGDWLDQIMPYVAKEDVEQAIGSLELASRKSAGIELKNKIGLLSRILKMTSREDDEIQAANFPYENLVPLNDKWETFFMKKFEEAEGLDEGFLALCPGFPFGLRSVILIKLALQAIAADDLTSKERRERLASIIETMLAMPPLEASHALVRLVRDALASDPASWGARFVYEQVLQASKKVLAPEYLGSILLALAGAARTVASADDDSLWVGLLRKSARSLREEVLSLCDSLPDSMRTVWTLACRAAAVIDPDVEANKKELARFEAEAQAASLPPDQEQVLAQVIAETRMALDKEE